MAIATQHYELNEDIQLSTVQQLTAFSTDYTWNGRTLTSWVDDVGETHQLDGTASFNRLGVKLSGQWILDRHQVSASIPTGHGYIEINMENREKPLATASDPWRKTVQLSNDQKTTVWYDSLLSIDVIPENENYTTTRFNVNGISQSLSDQYVYRNIDTDDKTGANEFIIIVDFNDITHDPSYTRFILADGTEDLCSIVGELDEQWLSEYGQYDEGTETWGKDIVHINIGNDVTSIGDYAFSGCRNLSNILLPNTITNIGFSAFKNCDSLLSIAIPDKVLSIDEWTFWNCINLSNVIIPNNLTSIGSNSFNNCYSLSTITIGNGVTKIGEEAFQNCYGLTSLTVPNTLISIGAMAFYGLHITNVTITNNGGNSKDVQRMLLNNNPRFSDNDVIWNIES